MLELNQLFLSELELINNLNFHFFLLVSVTLRSACTRIINSKLRVYKNDF